MVEPGVRVLARPVRSDFGKAVPGLDQRGAAARSAGPEHDGLQVTRGKWNLWKLQHSVNLRNGQIGPVRQKIQTAQKLRDFKAIFGGACRFRPRGAFAQRGDGALKIAGEDSRSLGPEIGRAHV